MAWTKSTINDLRAQTLTAVALPGSATTEYSSVINFLKPRCDGTNQYITFVGTVSAISGTNADIALYGSKTSAGTTKYLLKDAIVADLTNSAKVAAGVVDINAYPAPYYFIGWTADANEAANTITFDIQGDLGSI